MRRRILPEGAGKYAGNPKLAIGGSISVGQSGKLRYYLFELSKINLLLALTFSSQTCEMLASHPSSLLRLLSTCTLSATHLIIDYSVRSAA